MICCAFIFIILYSSLVHQEDRVKELTQKISETRQGVTEVKATIDTMRSTRDTHMADMNQLKAQARDQNQRSVGGENLKVVLS